MKKIIFLMSSILMLSATFTAYAEGEVIFQDDFDEYTWTSNKNVSVQDGWVTFDATNGGFTVEKTVGADMANTTELEIEYKLKFEESIDNIDNSWTFPRFIGKSNEDSEEEIYSAGIYLKRFLFYKKGGNTANYYFLPDLEYVIKAKLNYIKDTFEVEIFEEGTETPVQKHALNPQPITDMATLKFNIARFAVPKGAKVSVDYIKVLSTGLRMNDVTPDISKKIRTDSSIYLTFSHELDEETLSAIKVLDEDKNEVVCDIKKDAENNKKYEIYFPAGLLYDEKYTLYVSNELKSVEGKEAGVYEEDFTTEKSPFSIDSVLYYNQESKKISAEALSGVTALTNLLVVTNNSGMDKDLRVLNLIYDENNRLLKIENTELTVENKGTRYRIDMDLNGIESAAYVKTHIWDSIEGMMEIK